MASADTFQYSHQDATGVVFPASEVALASITDDTSHTYMLGEKYLNPDHYEDGWDDQDDHGMYGGCSPDNIRQRSHDPDNGFVMTPIPDTPGFTNWMGFGSAHAIGLHMAFCDGSVHTINYSIDPFVHA